MKVYIKPKGGVKVKRNGLNQHTNLLCLMHIYDKHFFCDLAKHFASFAVNLCV